MVDEDMWSVKAGIPSWLGRSVEKLIMLIGFCESGPTIMAIIALDSHWRILVV